MQKDILISALQPGMSARLESGLIVKHCGNTLNFSHNCETIEQISILTTKDYEIVENGDDMPWQPSHGDYGYQVDFMFEVYQLAGHIVPAAFKDRLSAEEFAREMELICTIRNMPGCQVFAFTDAYQLVFEPIYGQFKFSQEKNPHPTTYPFQFYFETKEQAVDAVNSANALITEKWIFPQQKR